MAPGVSELDIRSGGAIAVDTGSLRDAAAALRHLAPSLHELARLAERVQGQVMSAPLAQSIALDLPLRGLAGQAQEAEAVPGRLAAQLETLATVYDIIELRAERAAAQAAGDAVHLAAVDAALTAVSAAHPEALARVEGVLRDAVWAGPGELAGQVAEGTWWMPTGALFAASTALLAYGVAGAGYGRMDRAPARAGTRAPSVGVQPVAPRAPVTPVASLAEAAARIPGAAESRVRVERYTMPDGSAQFAVYIAGTQTLAGRTGDPFDMPSNVALYTGSRSASLESVDAALRAAGAAPGDALHVFGHSQGAMVAAALALENPSSVRTLVSFGSPVEAAVGPEIRSVGIRHLDDPVAALAGAGHPHRVGSPDSFLVERVADPAAGLQDLTLAAHGIDRYTQTAEMVDASRDPRAVALGKLWADLATASEVSVVEYSATRSAPLVEAPGPSGRISPGGGVAG